jgi:hypothetical protein
MAKPAQRKGQGSDVRTVMLGALMVNRRRRSFQRMS